MVKNTFDGGYDALLTQRQILVELTSMGKTDLRLVDDEEPALEGAISSAAQRVVRRRRERENGSIGNREQLLARIGELLGNEAPENVRDVELPIEKLIASSKAARAEGNWLQMLRINNNLSRDPRNKNKEMSFLFMGDALKKLGLFDEAAHVYKLGIEVSAFFRGGEVQRIRALLRGRFRSCLSLIQGHRRRSSRSNGR